jgi:2,3-bisphosphoglycerate-independent phosphoglycerate mutase
MKYVILHGGGMADVPHPNLGGKTPLQMAATPNMDLLARKGELGLVAVAAEGVPPGTTVGQLAFFGYDLHKHHCGPAPFEAVSQGVALGEHDVVLRCSMVTLKSGAAKGKTSGSEDIRKLTPQLVMEDAAAGGIEDDEARELIDAINEQLGSETLQFYPGADHRHLMVWVGGKPRALCRDPREAAGRPIGEFLPAGDGGDVLRQVMEASLMILQGHPVNEQRRQSSLKAANCLWLWGAGKAPNLPKLTDQYRIAASVLSSSDLIRGIGMCAGLDGVAVAASDGRRGSEFSALAQTTLRELAKKDFVYVHAQVPMETAAATDPKAKLQVLEEFDHKTVGPILEGLPKLGSHRVVLICDHAEPAVRQSQPPPVPYVLYAGSGGKAADHPRGFNEADAQKAQTGVRDASRLMNRLLSQQPA